MHFPQHKPYSERVMFGFFLKLIDNFDYLESQCDFPKGFMRLLLYPVPSQLLSLSHL